MRPLTEAEKADNREFARLAKKIAARDAKRTGKEIAMQSKRGAKAILRGTGKLAGKAHRHIKSKLQKRRERRNKK